MLALTVLLSCSILVSSQSAEGLLRGQNPCVSKQTCSECLTTPTCAWCAEPDYFSLDGSHLPRCNQEEFYLLSSRYVKSLRSDSLDRNIFILGFNVPPIT